MRVITIVLALLLGGCASLSDSARIGVGVDATTTVVAVSSGLAVEANPLLTSPAALVGSVAARLALTGYVDTLPEPERTTYLAGMSSLWFGVGMSNLVVILFASNPVGLVVGLITGVAWWNRTEDERLFAEVCAAETLKNPRLTCQFTANPIF